MNVWVKICGLTTEAGVRAAVAAGADAIGFVFAPSKRQVSVERALELARIAPRKTLRVAVMLHPQQSALDQVCSGFSPDVLQTDVDDLASLRVPKGLHLLPVVRSTPAGALPARLLFEGPVSGVGAPGDWTAAAALARRTELVLAGGLTAANVAAAIAQTRPFGVDVSSGVESAPGVKDPEKIVEFVRNARAGAEQCKRQ